MHLKFQNGRYITISTFSTVKIFWIQCTFSLNTHEDFCIEISHKFDAGK